MKRMFIALPALLIALAAYTEVRAEHTVIYVHGMKFDDYSWCQGQSTCRKWDSKKGKYKGAWVQQRSSGNIYHVGYDGRQDPHNFTTHGRGGYMLLKALNAKCKGSGKTCEMVCGSMGCFVIGDVLSRYGSAYNVLRVSALASGEGGSDMGQVANNILNGFLPKIHSYINGWDWWADLQAWLTNHTGLPYGASYRMRPSVARSSYNHNVTNGTNFYHKATYVPLPTRFGIFTGRNDLVSAHHSTCGYSSIKPYKKCGGETMRKKCKEVAGVRVCWGKKINYKPWSNHYASSGFSSTGLSWKVHGFFSSKGGQYH